MQNINRVHVLIIGIIGSALVVFFDSVRRSSSCVQMGNYEYENICLFAGILFLIFLPTLLLSLILFIVRSNSVYKSWLKFATYFVPAYILIVSIVPWYAGDEYLSISKILVASALSVIYFIISLGILGIGWWRERSAK